MMMSSPPPPSSTKGGGVGGAVGVLPPSTNTTSNLFFSPHFPKMTFSTANTATTLLTSTKVVGGTAADFGSLLANSSTLLSSMAQSTTTTKSMTTNSSPFLLGDVTRIASGGGGEGGGGRDSMRDTATSYAEESAAHRLLSSQVGQGGFNASDLGRRVRDLERRSFSGNHVTTTTSFGGREEEKKDNLTTSNYNNSNSRNSNSHNNNHDGSVNSILASHREYCINSAIRKSRESSDRLTKRRLEERLKKDWLERRERCLSSILGRDNRYAIIRGGNSSITGRNGGGEIGGVGGGLVAARVPLILDGDSSYHTTTTTSSVSIVPSPQSMPSGIENIIKYHQTAIDGYIIRSRSNIPTTTVTTTNNVTTSSISNAISLLNSLEDGTKDSMNGSNIAMNGYVNALSLIRSIINCRVSLPTSSLSSSSTLDVNTNVALDVVGACQHLANQFTFHIRDVIRENELGGYTVNNTNSNINNSTKARDICAYATIVVGRDVAEGRGGVWPKLFYCLRCGDLNTANLVVNEYDNVGSGNGDDDLGPDVIHLVSQLALLQQNQETIFGPSLLNPSQSMVQCQRRVADTYERTKTLSSSSLRSPDRPYAHYQVACLALLGGSDSISEASTLASSGLVTTVEDYLYASLWHAIHQADAISPSSSSMTMISDPDVGLRKVADLVARLALHVKEWGPSYFEQDDDDAKSSYISAAAAVASAALGSDTLVRGGAIGGLSRVLRSGGWAYALPLLISQQYATALGYLAEAGGGLGLLQATHVGFSMNAAGLSLVDFVSTEELSSMISNQEVLLPMLVASYSASLQGLDVGGALKYLVLLSGKDKFVKEQVLRLILETRQFEALAGKIESNGSRSNGALDSYFTKTETSSILLDSANHAIRVGKPADAAELLVLSGRFGSLFMLMNRELASYLHATTPEGVAKRQFWFNTASQFHAIHLAQGRTYVQKSLDSEGNMSLGNTFQLLMNLVVFFDRCRENQWEGSWVLMDDLQLIPKTESDMTVKVQAFHALDNCVRQVFHHVVLVTMEALCHIFQKLKQSGAGVATDQQNAVNQSLNDLRARARLLVTFARLLNLPSLGDSNTHVRISQLEKNMI